MLSNNPEILALVIVLIAGGLIFALGSFLVRRQSRAQWEEASTYEQPETAGSIFDHPGLAEALVIPSAAPDVAVPSVIPDVVIPSEEAQPRSRGTTQELELRLDMIERLVIVGQPWCVEELKRDFLTDPDERVRNAAEDAILVIATR